MTATEPVPDPGDVERVVELLDEMPAWSDPVGDDAREEQRSAIERAVAEIAAMDLDVIESGIDEFVAGALARPGGYDVAAMSKPFVVTRAVLASPSDVELDRPAFGGWRGVPIADGRINLLWPWSVAEDRLRLTGDFRGYMGEAYRAREEFAAFRERFGARPEPRIGAPEED